MPRHRYLAAEHQPEALRLLERKAHVSLTHGTQTACRRCLALRFPEHRKPFPGQRRQQGLAPRKMAIGCVVGNLGAARNLPQAERFNPFFLKDFSGCSKQGCFEIAMMVAALPATVC